MNYKNKPPKQLNTKELMEYRKIIFDIFDKPLSNREKKKRKKDIK